MTFPTEEQHATAVLARLNAGLTIAYERDKLPDPLPPHYIEFGIAWRPIAAPRRTGAVDSGTESFRFTTRELAKKVADARNLRRLARERLQVAFTVADFQVLGVNRETQDEIQEDEDGYYSGLTTWTYSV